MIAADGRVVWVRDQAVLLRDLDGRPLTWQGVMVDITAQKQAEEGLRTSNDDLEFRVLARTAQLEEANELMTLEIGERRRVERELRSAEERFRNLVEDLPAVVYRRQVAASDDDRDHSYAESPDRGVPRVHGDRMDRRKHRRADSTPTTTIES